MRIGIDGCCWSNRRGFGHFTRELVTHMAQENDDLDFVLVVDQQTASQCQFPDTVTLKVVGTSVQPTQAASAKTARSPIDMFRLGQAVAGLDLDVFFFPTVYSFYPLLKRLPTLITFCDATPENHPNLIFPTRRSQFFWRVKTRWAVRQASRILTISESAKSQIAAAFRLPTSVIEVISLGPSQAFAPIKDLTLVRSVLEKYRLPTDRPLILYVGGISPHKNLQGLLLALTHVGEHTTAGWHLVIVGDYENDSFLGCYRELVEQSLQLGLEDRITFTGYVTSQDLPALYCGARMFVLPSFNEGFGLPIVEAMACGVPVAASRRGSIPEVLGQAGVMFEPEDHGAMARSIGQLLEDDGLRSHLRDQGLERSKQFSWGRAARKTIQLLKGIASS